MIASVALMLMAAACGQAGEKSGQNGSYVSLAGAKIGGPFTLTSDTGKTVKWDDFKGRYRLVYFGYTYCPDVCPLDLQHIMQGFRQFEKDAPERAARVQPLFISVDPERDTPAVLHDYVSAFHPRLIGLTGSPQAIAAVAKQFAVVYGREQGSGKPGASAQYLVSHSRTPYLFGPDGQPIALVPVDDPATPEAEGKPEQIVRFLESQVR